jgi:protein associated with RNAse G/E
MITVNSRKYDGSIRKSWICEVVEKLEDGIVAVGRFDADVNHSDLGIIRRGTLSYEYFWLDRWYNIFRFVTADGSFRNYYCNICMPPEFSNNVLDYVDLDIDVVVDPDFSYRILDRDDFETNAALYNYPVEVRDRVETALRELLELIESRNLPGAAGFSATTRSSVRENG